MIYAGWGTIAHVGGCYGCNRRDGEVLVIGGDGVQARYCADCMRQIFEAARLMPARARPRMPGMRIVADPDVPEGELHLIGRHGTQVVKL